MFDYNNNNNNENNNNTNNNKSSGGSVLFKHCSNGHFKSFHWLLFNDFIWTRVLASDCACNKTVLVFVCFGTDLNEFLRMELPSVLSPDYST